jgi:cbb3-type cytochrome oxidase maturation protein
VEIIYILIPLSLALVAVIIGFVVWAVTSGQFEDLDRPAYRILDDDDRRANDRRGTTGDEEGKSSHTDSP